MQKVLSSLSLAAALAATPQALAIDATGGSFSSERILTAGQTLDLPLKSGGEQSVVFNIPERRKVVIIFEAQCATNAPAGDFISFTSIDIVVDGKVLPPSTGTGDVFCSANGTLGFDGYVRASMMALTSLGRGRHEVKVRATTANGSPVTGAHYSMISLVVLK
jgi:hypothetical protein